MLISGQNQPFRRQFPFFVLPHTFWDIVLAHTITHSPTLANETSITRKSSTLKELAASVIITLWRMMRFFSLMNSITSVLWVCNDNSCSELPSAAKRDPQRTPGNGRGFPLGDYPARPTSQRAQRSGSSRSYSLAPGIPSSETNCPCAIDRPWRCQAPENPHPRQTPLRHHARR